MPRDPLPLFPLPVVLFPGATLPLHIFEPRYRRLLADRLAADSRFGLIRLQHGLAEHKLPSGTVGCIAEIVSSETLPDGRSNILVRGIERFVFRGYADEGAHPYHVAWTDGIDDEPEAPETLALVADAVRDDFRAPPAPRTRFPVSEPTLPRSPPIRPHSPSWSPRWWTSASRRASGSSPRAPRSRA